MHDTNASCEPEVLLPIPAGTVVRLPDGDVGEAVWSSHAQVNVVHCDRTLGRGPWYFARHQVEAASTAERDAYFARCAKPAPALLIAAR